MYSYTAYILHVQCTVPSINVSTQACFCNGLLIFFSEILVSDLKMCK